MAGRGEDGRRSVVGGGGGGEEGSGVIKAPMGGMLHLERIRSGLG
jgi:hypothetical protein